MTPWDNGGINATRTIRTYLQIWTRRGCGGSADAEVLQMRNLCGCGGAELLRRRCGGADADAELCGCGGAEVRRLCGGGGFADAEVLCVRRCGNAEVMRSLWRVRTCGGRAEAEPMRMRRCGASADAEMRRSKASAEAEVQCMQMCSACGRAMVRSLCRACGGSAHAEVVHMRSLCGCGGAEPLRMRRCGGLEAP